MKLLRFTLILASLTLPLLVAIPSIAAPPKVAIYLSVFKANENTFWAQGACQKIYGLIQNGNQAKPEVQCDWNQDEAFLSEKTKLARRSGYFQYLLELRETATEYHLRWVNWSPKDDLDFTQAGWTIKKSQDSDLYLGKLLNNLMEQQTYRLGLRRHFMTQAIQMIQKTTLNHPLSEPEMSAFVAADPRNKAYVKTALAAVVVSGQGVSDEIKNKEVAKAIWDLDSMATMLGEKSQLKFPINWSLINSRIKIPFACKSDAMTELDILLCSNIASMTWEMILEYHQVVSFKNEALIASLESGFLGTLAQLRQIMEDAHPSLAQKNLREIFRTPQELDAIAPAKTTDLIHPFRISSQVTDRKTPLFEIPLDPKAPGPKKLITSLEFSQTFRENVMLEPYQDFTSTAQIALSAYYDKSQGRQVAQPLKGYNFFIGARKAVDNRTRFTTPENPKNTDFIGSVHVLGSTLMLETYSHGWRIQTTLDVYADFASVRSYVLERYAPSENDPMYMPIDDRKNYYYGIGTTNIAKIVFEHGNFSFDISGQHSQISNLNGRQPAPLLQGARADSFTGLEFGTQYRFSNGLVLRLAINETQRNGTVEDVGLKNGITETIGLQLIYRF